MLHTTKLIDDPVSLPWETDPALKTQYNQHQGARDAVYSVLGRSLEG
ncbi:hypothetical protein [Corynebacterium kalinowskii]|nr:hypothetical protein [Corynebacterium kalinowskii]